jgi:hypothetical protein
MQGSHFLARLYSKIGAVRQITDMTKTDCLTLKISDVEVGMAAAERVLERNWFFQESHHVDFTSDFSEISLSSSYAMSTPQ